MSCSNTNVAPLQLSFSNQSLTSTGEAQSWGVGLQIGTPPQLISFTPSTGANNTYVNNIAYCGSNSNTSCIQSIGGGYNQEASSTASGSIPFDAWNGSVTDIEIGANSGDIFVNDVMKLKDNTIYGFPFVVEPGNGYYSFPEIGLGKNSTFIQAAIDVGAAPSDSWSFYSGIYADTGAGGSLIIGGYSEDLYEGEIYTKNMSSLPEDNPMLQSWVEAWPIQFVYDVVGLNWTTSNGTFDIMGSADSRQSTIGQEMVLMIDPFYSTLTVPNSVFYNWGNATKGVYDEVMELYRYTSIPEGNLTVTLKDGLVSEIPYWAIFDSPGNAFDNGYLGVYRNASTRDTIYSLVAPWYFYDLPDYNNAALFGMPYTAFLYLVRDYERQTAQIANANQNAVATSVNVKTICPLHADQRKESGGSGTNVGAIAGGVVGGVVGLALIGVLVWFLLRRKNKKSKELENESGKAAATGMDQNANESNVGGRAELRPDSVVLPAYSEKDRAARQSLLANEPQELSENSRPAPIAEAPGSPGMADGELPAETPQRTIRAELPG